MPARRCCRTPPATARRRSELETGDNQDFDIAAVRDGVRLTSDVLVRLGGRTGQTGGRPTGDIVIL
ncbi:hypothetical protein ABZS83_33805 [Streptomyces sp. NPDC005426]|uniref:hypothetical protein n=1 Tax=Streptomyces sp. NPDC005426 TaxID=3155344 RepID=UPI0033B4E51F